MTTETAEILERYSTPGLKRKILSRYGMKWRLLEAYRMTAEEREKLLDDLYGVEE